MVNFIEFFLQYKAIIIFYLVIILLVVIYRKKVEIQAKIIFLFRMKFGLKAMDKFVKKYREWVILSGYIGTGIGFIGMLFISIMLIYSLIKIFITPEIASGVQLVLPGINVPGIGVLPFWYWLIAIFIIATVHEFSHGIVARAHNIPVKNTGIVLFGPIIGAFVEPDEKKMQKESDIAQYSVLAAGSFSNILLAIVALVLFMFVLTPVFNTMVEPAGFSFSEYLSEDYPAAMNGFPKNLPITSLNGQEITNFQDFTEIFYCVEPEEKVDFMIDGKSHSLITTENPDNEGHAYLGITGFKNEVVVKEKFKEGLGWISYNIVLWVKDFLKWLYLLSLGIGLFNLLPLPIVDGGRMAQVALHRIKGKKKGEKHYHAIGLFFLLILLFLLLFPYLFKLF
jgi:membrane-associated protease RseP (regulator of RpoE activity)